MPDPLFPSPQDRGRGRDRDEEAERALRRVLAAQAAAVRPGDPPRVQDLVDRRVARRWPAALGVAAAVTALAVTSAVALRPDETTEVSPSVPGVTSSEVVPPVPATSAPAEPSTATPPSATPSSLPSAAPSVAPTSVSRPASATPEPPAPERVPALVWSVVDRVLVQGAALQLVPDRAQVEVADTDGDPADPEVLVRSAVRHLLMQPAPDPDHTNLWAGGTLGADDVVVDVTGSGTTLDLPGSALDGSLGGEAASLAVQALVRTVVSNGGTAPVTVLVDGRAGAEAWGVLVLDEPLSPGTQDLAGGWVLDPYEGQRLRAGTVTLSGTATVPDGSVSWAVRDADGSVVQEGAARTGSTGDHAPWSVPVDLPPGVYTAVLRAENTAGPQEPPGPWLWEETRSFTVVP